MKYTENYKATVNGTEVKSPHVLESCKNILEAYVNNNYYLNDTMVEYSVEHLTELFEQSSSVEEFDKKVKGIVDLINNRKEFEKNLIKDEPSLADAINYYNNNIAEENKNYKVEYKVL